MIAATGQSTVIAWAAGGGEERHLYRGRREHVGMAQDGAHMEHTQRAGSSMTPAIAGSSSSTRYSMFGCLCLSVGLLFLSVVSRLNYTDVYDEYCR